MYIGPWQEYRLAKLHKHAVETFERLANELPSAGDSENGLTAGTVASALASFQEALGNTRSRGRLAPRRRNIDSARSTVSMPSIYQTPRRGDLRSSSSAPDTTQDVGRDGVDEEDAEQVATASRSGASKLGPGARNRRRSRKRKKKGKNRKMPYISRAMREVNRRRQLYMNPNRSGGTEHDNATSASGAESR